jgi:two-component system nitrate/nitrite response regulator NarP
MNQLATEELGDEIFSKLTPRQSQVLKLICHRGLSNKAIGNILKISESTVKIHTSAILKRYGVKNRTQLVLAYSNKLKA